MAESNKTSESAGTDEPAETVKGYAKLLERLKRDQRELKTELERDYREARGYVRSHPEEGILVAFVGGLALGILLGGLSRRR